jgi:hypothetical protein
MVKRSFLIVLLVTLLLAVTTTVAYAADPDPEPGQQDEGGIDKVIGTLGLYAAMMAVLAVGTEVVIDMVRPIFGLQRKMNADEAFAKLKEQLPKTLEELGVSKEAKTALTDVLEKLETTTGLVGEQAEKARAIVHEKWPDILADLATQSADEVLKRHWETLQKKLGEAGVPAEASEKVRTWLVGAISEARKTGMIDLQGPLTLVNGVLEEVKVQQNKIQGPLRKLWRWLRDSLIRLGEQILKEGSPEKARFRQFLRSLCFLPAYIEYGWARLRGSLEGGVKINEGIKKLGEVVFEPARSLQEAARRILEEDVQQGLKEEKRVKWLRIISAVVGIILAATLSLDSLQLLEPVLGSAANTFHKVVEAEEALKPEDWYNLEQVIERADKNPDNDSFDPQRDLGILDPILEPLLKLTPGIILSGMGAAAGSGFWHDVLDKLRTAKQVAGMVKTAKEALKGENEEQ